MPSQKNVNEISASKTVSRKPFFRSLFRFRFSLKSFLILLTLACALLAWVTNRIPHCRAVEELQRLGVHITWERQTPTWLDEKLGLWRLDRIKDLHYSSGPELDLSVVNDLEYLGGFGTHETSVITYDPLLNHTATIKSLFIDSPPQNPADFYAKFHQLEELGLFCKIDLSRLQHLNLKSIYNYGVREIDVDAMAAFKNLEFLDLSGSNIRSTEKLVGLSKLRTLIFYSCNQLKDLKGLDQLPSLTHLEFDDCSQLTNLDAINRCIELETLCPPAGVELTSITELKKLKELHSILDMLDPENLEVLGCFPALEGLRLNWEGRSRFDGVELDLRLLKEKPNLKYLSACRVTHLEHLANFEKLETLHLRDSDITNADVILSLKHLKKITTDKCRMSDDVFAALQAGKTKWELARIKKSKNE